MSGRRRPQPPRLDRFGTLNAFVGKALAELTRDTGSGNAGLVWFVLFRMASAKDGTVRGASVSKLSRLTGLDRRTVATALRRLVEKEAVRVEKPGAVPVYVLEHMRCQCTDQH